MVSSEFSLTPILLIAISALLLAVSVTPLMRRLALQTGTVDKPGERKIHANPVPLLGGAAIYAAFIAVLLFFGDRSYINQVVGIFVGATLMSFMGVVDDRWGLGSYIKLGGQLLAAWLLVYSGVQVNLFGGWLDVVITMLWVVGITNAMNLLDNMDGLAGGIGMIAATYFTLLAAMSDQYLVGALAAALMGACAGFLLYNWNPAHIFMGDAGSLFLGFMLSAVAIKLRFPSNSVVVTWMIPLLVLAVPIFDTTIGLCQPPAPGQEPLDDAWQGSYQPSPCLHVGQQARGCANLLSDRGRGWPEFCLCGAGRFCRGCGDRLHRLRLRRFWSVVAGVSQRRRASPVSAPVCSLHFTQRSLG